jgi:hypothetical protein
MNIGKEEYFFYEWLIIEKKMSKEEFDKLTDEEFKNLKLEFMKFCN